MVNGAGASLINHGIFILITGFASLMKKTIIFYILAFCTMASGQEYSFHQGEEEIKKAYQPEKIKIAPGVGEGQVLTVEPLFNIFSTVKGVQVKLYDSVWKETKSVKIDETKQSSIEYAKRIGGNLHVAIGNVKKRNFFIKHVAVDAATLDIVSDSLLINLEFSKKEECYYHTASSPNGEYFGVVYILLNEKTKQTKTTALLYDNKMSKLWERPLEHGLVHQMLVTDNGEVVTAALAEDGESDGTIMLYNTADVHGAKHGSCIVKEEVQQISLLQFNGGKILTTALEVQGGGFMSTQLFTGFHVYLFNMKENRLAGNTYHAFTGDDIQVLENKLDPDLSFLKTNNLSPLDQIPTPWGGTVLYHRMWMEGYRNMKTGMTTNERVYSKGILMVNIDTLGNIMWIRGIMQNNQNANWPAVGADLILQNNNLYVVTNESKEESDEYTPNQLAKSSSSFLLANCALSIYSFTPEGKGSKKMLAKDGKFLLFTPLYAVGNGKYYLLTGGTSPKMSSLTIQ